MARQVQLLNNIFSYTMIVFLLAGCSSAAHRVNEGLTINNTNNNLKLQNGVMYLGDKLFTGNIFSLYTGSADTAEITGYKEGREHGIFQDIGG